MSVFCFAVVPDTSLAVYRRIVEPENLKIGVTAHIGGFMAGKTVCVCVCVCVCVACLIQCVCIHCIVSLCVCCANCYYVIMMCYCSGSCMCTVCGHMHVCLPLVHL